MNLIFGKSVAGRRALRLPKSDVPTRGSVPANFKRTEPAGLPEVSELDAVRHFTRLSQRNMGVDTNFYPLGSCTMKYNPKLGEQVARQPGFTELHPLLVQLPGGEMLAQGALGLLYETARLLCEITGMAEFTTQPLAGAHGELTGLLIIAAYHQDKGSHRTKVLLPDSAHGTNPASAAIAGYQVVTIPSDESGVMDLGAFSAALDKEVAGVMLTCPNTLGLFNPRIAEIAKRAHSFDALMYYDGANLNALLGKCRPGDLGFDVIHLNLHKTFATPHGGGGPGAGPVGVCSKLQELLPAPTVVRRKDGRYALDYDKSKSIGRVAPFFGNFGVIVRAYSYILTLGRTGLVEVAENAVLNANYIMEKLKSYYQLPYDRRCMHECVFSASRQAQKGVRAFDIAKALLDRGFHPMTMYFPLIVKEAMMIEPTETECKETLDQFIEAMVAIAKLAETDPDALHRAPTTTPVGRVDEVTAARRLDLAV